MSKKFNTMWAYKPHPTRKLDTTQMTVPNQALTNVEHVKNIRLGMSPQTVQMIFDPHNTFPDLRAMDIVDQKLMLKQVREQVQEIRARGEKFIAEKRAEQAAKEQEKYQKFQTQLDQLKKEKEAK